MIVQRCLTTAQAQCRVKVEAELRAGLVRDRQESQIMCAHLLQQQNHEQLRACREDSEVIRLVVVVWWCLT